jgi:hypothetical protein
MITTDKDIASYSFTCDRCGKEIEFASNQPDEDQVPIICECFTHWTITIALKVDVSSNYKFRMREDTRKLRKGIISIFQDIRRSMTVRQIFYQAVCRGLVPKDEQKGYSLIQRNILEMRRLGHLPYSFVSDLSRRMVKPITYDGLGDALNKWMRYYRQDVWARQGEYVEIWLEKDALSGIFSEITNEYDVPLFIARGFSSESFLYEAANQIKAIGKPTFIYFFSDYDLSGLRLCEHVEKKLPVFGAKINFIRAALTPDQIRLWNLPTRPSKQGFESESTELDAIHPDTLQALIRSKIENHITQRDMENIKMEETVQRESLNQMKVNFLRQA